VGEGFCDQGDAIVAFGGQRFEFEFGHVSLQTAIVGYAALATGRRAGAMSAMHTKHVDRCGLSSAVSLFELWEMQGMRYYNKRPGAQVQPGPGVNH
ncbi:hypothetical protein, partial [Herbaspirillum sp.]|uniref:hypothetical protein n=1 Tax=Herbaspirillum sp. TaxID=1890675 RepID=UPI0031D043C5